MSVLLIYFEGVHRDTCKVLEFVDPKVSRGIFYFILFIYVFICSYFNDLSLARAMGVSSSDWVVV
jgi:hypothetical protein